MFAQGWARRLLYFFVLALTSLANLLFIPVDNDGDDSTPPVIFSFKFVAPENTSPTSGAQKNVQNATGSQIEPTKSPVSFSTAFSLHTTEAARITPHITPLRC